MERYRKFLVALAAALAVLGTGLADDGLTGTEIIAAALAGLGALGVWAVPNETTHPLPPPPPR